MEEFEQELIRILAAGLGVGPDGSETPYLQRIAESLAEIKDIMQQGQESSETLRAQAEAVLAAHAESAQQYIREVEQPPAPDFHPFMAVPAGTGVRELPDGGRLFTLADGVLVRVGADGALTAIDLDGEATVLEPARGGIVTLPDGRELLLKPDAVRVTHEAAGIEGLPLDIEPIQTGQGRFRVELPGGFRLDVLHRERAAMVGNPSGTVVVLGILKIEGVGEDVETRLVPGGAKGFSALESGHKGIVEAGGTIHLAMANGLDLVIRFPEEEDAGQGTDTSDEPACICEERG